MSRLRRALVLARRELTSLLAAPLGWIILAGWSLLAGDLWIAMIDRYASSSLERVYSPWAAGELDPIAHLVAPWQSNLSIVLLVVGPAITMRSLAEESRRGTLELLLASPASAAEIVVGKYLGAMAYCTLLLAWTGWMPLLIAGRVPLDAGAVLSGTVGLFAYAACVVAIGLLASASTDSPALAMILSFAVCLVLWIAGWIDPDPTSLWTQLSLSGHLVDAWLGLLRASDLAYVGGLVGAALVLATLRVEAGRYL